MIKKIRKGKIKGIFDFFNQFKDEERLLINGNEVAFQIQNPNITIYRALEGQTLKMFISIKENTKIKKPVYLCVGFSEKTGKQEIDYEIKVEKNVECDFISHCYFPAVNRFSHTMHSKMTIGENSKVIFNDIHYHGEAGNIQVDSNYVFLVGKNSELKNYFDLTQERAGLLNLHATFSLDEKAKVYSEAKLKERLDDRAVVEELIYLNGDYSSGVAKTYIVGEDESVAEVINEVYAYGNHTTGHIECDELIAGEKVSLSAIPKLVVTNNTSEITHEAAVGRLNTEQLETLMTKGLTEEEATEMIINGLFDD